MSHTHNVVDTDPRYIIDPITREIMPGEGSTKKIIMQYDHNSERLGFTLPRYIDGHDMSTCNKVEVHYTNTGPDDAEVKGVCEVEDLAVSETDEDSVVCTWLITGNATELAGGLVFSLSYICETDGMVDYAWSTNEYTGLSVSTRRRNSEAVVKQIPDVLEQYKETIIEQVAAQLPVDVGYLPEVAAEDEGKLLQVVNGIWAAIDFISLGDNRLGTTSKTVVGAINEIFARLTTLQNQLNGTNSIVQGLLARVEALEKRGTQIM